jgi:hypothetical protein
MGWRCTGDERSVGCRLGQGREPDKCRDYDDYANPEYGESSGSEDEGEDMEGIEGNDSDAELNKMLDGEGDEDYQYEEPDEEELLEYQSDDDMPDAEDNAHMETDSDAEIDLWDPFKRAMSLWSDTEKTGRPPKHKCFRGTGYSGKLITAEEMTGCCTAQCLLVKAAHGAEAEEPDDQDFEIGGKFCLSGLCGHVCSRDSGGEAFVPNRHGVRDAIVESWVRAILFHPCVRLA